MGSWTSRPGQSLIWKDKRITWDEFKFILYIYIKFYFFINISDLRKLPKSENIIIPPEKACFTAFLV